MWASSFHRAPVLRHMLRGVVVLGASLLVATCSEGPTEPPPPPPVLAQADSLALDFATRQTVDVRPIAGTSQRLVLRLETPQAGDSLAARLSRAGLVVDSTIILGAPGTSARQSVWIARDRSAGPLTLELTWIRRGAGTTVTAFLLPPTIEPERARQHLVAGDSIVEYLDGDADEDLFIVDGPAQARVTVWLQLDSASQPIRIQMGTNEISPSARTSALTDRTPEPLVIVHELGPVPVMTVLVRAAAGTVGVPAPIEARYRLWLEQIDRAPESTAAIAVAGDTIVERIDGFGDLDRFEIREAQGEEVRVFLARDSLSVSPVHASLHVNDGPPIPFTLGAGDSVLDLRRSPWVQKNDATAAIVEVVGDTSVSADRGPVGYRLLYQRRARAPETAPTALGLVDSVVTETLASCADADDFEISGPPLTMVSIGAFLHGAPGCRVRVRLMVGEGDLGAVDSLLLGTDPDVDRWPPLPIQASGKLRLRIEGIDAPGQPIGRVPDVGYTLDVYAVDSTPEIAPVDLALGDSLVSETIDRCSDRDAFDIVGPPGTVVVVAFGLGRETTCRLAVSSGFDGSGFVPAGGDEDARRFGHLTIPASGRVPLVVATEPAGTSADRGAPYFLKATAVNTAPELAAPLVTFGDTIQETVARCGDIDRFEVPMVAGQGYWLRFDRARTSSCAVDISARFGLFTGMETTLMPGAPVAPVLVFLEAPETGTYVFSVSTRPSGHTDDRGLPYAFSITSEQNEVAPSALAVGDTSAIEPWAPNDLDLFVVPVQAGRRYVASTLGSVMFSTREEAFGPSDVSFDPHARGFRLAFTPTVTADRRFRLGLAGAGALATSFRFMVHELVTAPETSVDTLMVGDTSVVESFEHPGDEDHFVAALTPGRTFRLESFPSAGTTGALGGEIVSAAGDTLEWVALQGNATTRRLRVPAAGRVVARLKNSFSTSDTTQNPAYRVRFVDIDPAPESRSTAVAPGDSIVEALNDPYDLDEFTVSVATTGTYIVRFEAPASCGGAEDRLRLEIRLGDALVTSLLSRTDAAAAGSAALTAGNSYRLAVEAENGAAGACLLRDYRVSLARQP